MTLATFQRHGVIIDASDVLCAQLMRDLFAIAKFLVLLGMNVIDFKVY